jgi:NifU-like protein involved in Fe-S cluster formation
MTDLSELYNARIIELAAGISGARRLEQPDASASAHSKLCGDSITVVLKVRDGRISDFGQTVKACLLGQASASVVASNIVGSSASELRDVSEAMRRMLKENGPPPGGRWKDLAVLEPVRDVKARHASTLLVFEAVGKALDQIDAKQVTTA